MHGALYPFDSEHYQRESFKLVKHHRVGGDMWYESEIGQHCSCDFHFFFSKKMLGDNGLVLVMHMHVSAMVGTTIK